MDTKNQKRFFLLIYFKLLVSYSCLQSKFWCHCVFFSFYLIDENLPISSFAIQWNLDLTNLCIMKSRYNKRVIVKHMEKNHQYNDICHCELIWLVPWPFVVIIGVPLYYVKLFIFFFSSKVDQIQEIVTGNPAVIRMVVHFNRWVKKKL